MNDIDLLLLKLGIHSTYRGFHYLRYAISLCLQDEQYLFNIYKGLYVDIAIKYNVSRDSVEHCIRTVISYCWYNGNRNLLYDIAMYPLTRKQSNGEFIDILYNHLKHM